MNIVTYMDQLFENCISYEDNKKYVVDPLQADCMDQNSFCHYQKCYRIDTDKIKVITKRVIIKDLIDCLYFLYVDALLDNFDDKYWFFVGKLKNDFYFAYESGCCGTGFGLGSESTLYVSFNKKLLIKYGLTDKQRDLIFKEQNKNNMQNNYYMSKK